MEQLLLDRTEAMAALKIRKELLAKLEADGEIVAVRVGRRVLYPAHALRQYVERLTAAAAGSRA